MEEPIKIHCLFPGPEYRAIFMTEVFELVYHGGGGFSWSEVWNMPVSHRRFNLKKIYEYIEKVEQMKNEHSNTINAKTDTSKIRPPKFIEDSTFISKVKSKK